jgi:hypothetical protein
MVAVASKFSYYKYIVLVSWTNLSQQDKTWATLSTIDVGVFVHAMNYIQNKKYLFLNFKFYFKYGSNDFVYNANKNDHLTYYSSNVFHGIYVAIFLTTFDINNVAKWRDRVAFKASGPPIFSSEKNK